MKSRSIRQYQNVEYTSIYRQTKFESNRFINVQMLSNINFLDAVRKKKKKKKSSYFACYNKSRTAQTTVAVTKLKVIWNDKNITISSKIRLMRSLAMSVFLYACETWTMTTDIEGRIQASEIRCFRKFLGISYRDHITNEEVKARFGNAIGSYEDLLTSVKRRKLKWYGHVTRPSGLAKTILQGTVQGGSRKGRQRKRWEDNIKAWTGLEWNIQLRKAENPKEWRKLVVKSTVMPQRSARLRDRLPKSSLRMFSLNRFIATSNFILSR